MKLAVFNTRDYEQTLINTANSAFGHDIHFFTDALNIDTVSLAGDSQAVSAFVNDDLDEATLECLHQQGVRLIALRCAGFNNIDMQTARRLGICVVRVPKYSPHAVAEHAVTLMLALNRHLPASLKRTSMGDFSLDGLVGFDMYGKTAGIIGTGNIGTITARILHGFGCKLIAVDIIQNDECLQLGVEYVDLDRLYETADIISLHCPLLASTKYLINKDAIEKMKAGVMLINTARGPIIDTQAVIEGLRSGKIAYLGLDVYEHERGLFFCDHSGEAIIDLTFNTLVGLDNVLLTGHQAFLTKEALRNIANTTLQNITDFENGVTCQNLVSAED